MRNRGLYTSALEQDKWWELVNAITDFWVKQERGISSLSNEVPSSQGLNCHMYLIHGVFCTARQ
jgi:hypothetical protein